MTEKSLPRWNLSSLFKSESEAKAALVDIAKNVNNFSKLYSGKLIKLEAKDLAASIKKYEEICDSIHCVGTYAYLCYVVDMASTTKSAFYQFVNEKLADIGAKVAFFALEINSLDNTILQSDDLKHYAPFLRDIRMFKPYELSRELEEFSIQKNITSNAWIRFYDETLAGLAFNIDGQIMNISHAIDLLANKDGLVRAKAAKEIGSVFKKNAKTFAFITNTLIKDKSIDDEIRGFSSPISSRNLANFVEDDIVNALLTKVSENYQKTSHRYYALKARMLGLKQLEYWDRNAPLPFAVDKTFSYDEAQQIVLDSYSEFSPKMTEIGKEFFKNNWIDVPPSQNKDSGAFSHPCAASKNPFIMLNYLGKARDVSTLAHELGHGIHQSLARKQGSLMASTSLTLSETASVFGEQLIFQKLLKTMEGKNRLAFLCSKIEDSLNTSVRQIAFCKFETLLHDARKNGELSEEQICNAWLTVQKESLGDGVNLEGDYKFYWCYISHFIHSPFYVYAYAFGEILVNSLYSLYQSGKISDFANKYIDLLSAGGTKHHKEILSPFGVDISNAEFWNLAILEEMINEAETTFNKLEK